MFIKSLDHAVRHSLRSSPAAPFLRKIFRAKPLDYPIKIALENGWSYASEWLLTEGGVQYLLNRELNAKLRNHINEDVHTELLLTELRKRLLLGPRIRLNEKHIQEVACSLVSQCINNEYVWYVTEEEKTALSINRQKLEEQQFSGVVDWRNVTLLAMYDRVDYLFENGNVDYIWFTQDMEIPPCIRRIIDKNYSEFREESILNKSIEKIGEIDDATSRLIAGNYEKYPYPRWLDWEMPKIGGRKAKLSRFFDMRELEFLNKPFDVLVAGCGTGSKAIEYAIGYGNDAQVLGIDISRASLAYATRMARLYNVSNVKFVQMDLLDISKLDRKFDIVECTGVLHHMQEPAEGGKALVSGTKENGIVHISLYSELARRSIVKLRHQYNLLATMSDDEIREQRHRMMLESQDVIDHELSLRWDFFDLHRCKDLLFHPLEHRFTLPMVEQLLEELGIEFRGLERPPLLRNQYWTHYPANKYSRNIQRWHEFEKKNPDAFSNLYEIWSIKKATN